jgi:CBS domain-containing protein
MTMDLIVVPPTEELRSLAATMITRRVHSVVVAHPIERGANPRSGWQVVSDLDVLEHRNDLSVVAGSIARTAPLVVSGEEMVARAAQLLAEHRVGHLLVTGFDGEPLGIASSLDVLRGLLSGPVSS